MPDFNSILNKKTEDVVKPKPRPIGTYLAVLQGIPTQREAGDEKMEVMRHKVKLIAAKDDVNQDQLAEHPPCTEWAPFNYDWFVNSDGGQHAWKEWMVNVLGIESESKTLGQMAAETPGRQLLVKLKHRPFVNKQNEAETATEIESSAHA